MASPTAEYQREYMKRPGVSERTNSRRRERRKDPRIWAQYIIWHIRNRAKEAGIECTITHDDIVMPEVCPVFNVPLEFRSIRGNPNGPSIDRKDNTKGYVPGNVFVISKRANTLKSNASIADVKALLLYMEGPTP